jgi:hypothetical protein
MPAPPPRRRREVSSNKLSTRTRRRAPRLARGSHRTARHNTIMAPRGSVVQCPSTRSERAFHVRVCLCARRWLVCAQGQRTSLDVRIDRAMCLRSSHSHSRCVPSSFLAFLFLSPRWRRVHWNPCRHTGRRSICPHERHCAPSPITRPFRGREGYARLRAVRMRRACSACRAATRLRAGLYRCSAYRVRSRA